MKTRGITDLYLPQNIARHVKYLLFCAAFTPIWGVIIKVELTKTFLTATFLMMFLMIEILTPLSNMIFEFKSNYTRKGITQKEITLIYLTRLLLLYVVIIILASIVFALFIIAIHLIAGNGFPDLPLIFKQSAGVFKVAAIALFFTTPMFFFIPWQQSMKREFELREQNLIFQNETLKSQVNPHFLFNSLNTLSSLVNTQTEIANHFINKLSSIYRYILDNSSKVKVPLSDELEFIRNYFYLHQIRNELKILLHIDIENDRDFEILPVSLQLLIENAIKHNMATLEKPLRITINLEDKHIVVKNNLQKMATRAISTKIGLKNLNERVKLITGNGIIIEETGSDFIVKVPLMS
jgi:hypothetical protein